MTLSSKTHQHSTNPPPNTHRVPAAHVDENVKDISHNIMWWCHVQWNIGDYLCFDVSLNKLLHSNQAAGAFLLT